MRGEGRVIAANVPDTSTRGTNIYTQGLCSQLILTTFTCTSFIQFFPLGDLHTPSVSLTSLQCLSPLQCPTYPFSVPHTSSGSLIPLQCPSYCTDRDAPAPSCISRDTSPVFSPCGMTPVPCCYSISWQMLLVSSAPLMQHWRLSCMKQHPCFVLSSGHSTLYYRLSISWQGD